MSKAYGLPGLRIGWIACRDRALLDKLERAKHYTSICNSAPSEILALIGLRARDRLLERNRGDRRSQPAAVRRILRPLSRAVRVSPGRKAVASASRAISAPTGSKRCAPSLVEQAGVLLLPSSIYSSELAETPADRFRVGLGRSGPEEALEQWAAWLDK